MIPVESASFLQEGYGSASSGPPSHSKASEEKKYEEYSSSIVPAIAEQIQI
jgi:hypothetical protein